MMSHQTILIIDDDTTLLELLSGHLETAGYHPLVASDGLSGLRLAAAVQPDLVVLDVMMPDMDGWEVCRRLREQSSVPIIMLTAKGEEFDKLRGFRLGVDDYVTKPFSFAELTARLGAVLARATHAPASTHRVTSGDVTIDFDQRRVTRAGHIIDLTPTEYHLLEILARHAYWFATPTARFPPSGCWSTCGDQPTPARSNTSSITSGPCARRSRPIRATRST